MAALGVASCSTGSSKDADDEAVADERAAEVAALIGPIPALPEAILGPGTALGQGFVVEEGSALVGVAFPKEFDRAQDGSEVPDLGFAALLLLTDDLHVVMRRYRDRAISFGLGLSGSSEGDCTLDGAAISCELSGSQGGSGHTRWLRLIATQGPATETRPAQSHLFVEYGQVGQSPFPPPDPLIDFGPGVSTPSSVPTAWGPLAELGDTDIAATEIAGGRLVAPAQRWIDGQYSVFVIEGDPEDAIDDALVASGVDTPQLGDLRHWSEGGDEMTSFFWANGQSWFVTTASRPGSPTYLLIDHIDAD